MPRRKVTLGLAGCGIWLIFVAIFGRGAENRSGKREFQLRAGAGIGMRESQGESSGIQYFNFYETVRFDQGRLIEMDRL